MNRFVSHFSLRRSLVLLGLVILIGAFALPQLTAIAAPDSVQKLKSGSFGITPFQTVRVSVVNTSGKDVTVSMNLLDEQGQVELLCDGLVVEPGETYSMDLDGSKFVLSGPPRHQLRAQVWVHTADATIFGKLLPTIEVFDSATGQTTAVYPARGAQE